MTLTKLVYYLVTVFKYAGYGLLLAYISLYIVHTANELGLIFYALLALTISFGIERFLQRSYIQHINKQFAMVCYTFQLDPNEAIKAEQIDVHFFDENNNPLNTKSEIITEEKQ